MRLILLIYQFVKLVEKMYLNFIVLNVLIIIDQFVKKMILILIIVMIVIVIIVDNIIVMIGENVKIVVKNLLKKKYGIIIDVIFKNKLIHIKK